MRITRSIAAKILETVDMGLRPALGDDNLACVDCAVLAVQTELDRQYWSSDERRARGLRRLMMAQLDSRGAIDTQEFTARLAVIVVQKFLSNTIRSKAKLLSGSVAKNLLEVAVGCEVVNGLESAARSAERARHAAEFARHATEFAAAFTTEHAAKFTTDKCASEFAIAFDAAWSAARTIECAAECIVKCVAESIESAKHDATRHSALTACASERALDADVSAMASVISAAESVALAARSAASDNPDHVVWSKAAADDVRETFAEAVVQVLIDMRAPGVAWLELTETRNGEALVSD